MNAALRAVVRTAIANKVEVVGILEGFNGLVTGNFIDLDARVVSNILQRGGTILRSARSAEFRTTEGRKQAFDNLKKTKLRG